ncbi:BrnT family toxin [Bradyrhizobium sp.]
MKVTFDPAKRLATLRERGIDFATDAEKVFAGRVATVIDDRFDYGEVRNSTAGWLDGRMVTVIWTARGFARHVISMRYCHAREIKKLLKLFE